MQRTGLMLALLLLASGCSSITGTPFQSVSVETRQHDGAELKGAACKMNNNKGQWFVTTPGTVVINRSNDDMQVLCEKENHDSGRASVVSATKGSMFGNIIFGGGIGAIIDHNQGTAYEYPSSLRIEMGTTLRLGPPDLNGTPPPATTTPGSEKCATC